MRSIVRRTKRWLHPRSLSDLAASRFAALRLEDYELPADVLERTMTPALIVYRDRVRRNVRKILDLVDGDVDRWRPHVKTTKSTAIFDACIAQGLRRFKCATTREALVLSNVLETAGEGGDVLVAFPMVGPNLERLTQIAAARPSVRFSVLVEDPVAAADPTARNVDVFLDVNVGMDRSGVPFAEASDGGLAVRVAEAARTAGRRFRGLHLYDGHSSEWADGTDRDAGCREVQERAARLIATIRAAGFVDANEIITAGTPSTLSTIRAHREVPIENGILRQISPGTVVLHDLTSERANRELDLEPAAVVLSRVVSHPTHGMITCDAGSKSVAAEAGHPMCFVVGRPDWTPEKCSEEHLPIRLPPEDLPPRRGSTLYLIPRHVCPTVNLAESALFVDDDGSVTVESIDARAHELLLPPARSV